MEILEITTIIIEDKSYQKDSDIFNKGAAMARGGYDLQIGTLDKIICEDVDPIQIYLRFVRFELHLKNRLMMSAPDEFKKNVKNYHGHKLKEMLSDLKGIPSDQNTISQDLVEKTQELLKALSYNSIGQVKNPSYPYLRYLDCLSDTEASICSVVRGALESLSENCQELEKWLRKNP